MPKVSLNNMLVIELHILSQGGCHLFRVSKIGAFYQVRKASIKTFHHAIGLGMFGRDQAMFNVQPRTGLVKPMVAGWLAFTVGGKAVGKLLAIIGQDDTDVHGAFLMQAPDKGSGRLCAFVMDDFQVDPAGCPVDSHQQVTLLRVIGHVGQVLDVDMDIARLIVLEGLGFVGF